jgi:hypothetical protein
MKTTAEICNYIKENEKLIISNLKYKDVKAYIYIFENVKKYNVKESKEFQKNYKLFYKLNNAGLTNEIIDKYFEVMEKAKINLVSVDEIVYELYKYKRRKGDYSVQFSFATKLINTVNNEYPIFDSKVKILFGFPNLYGKFHNCSEILERYKIQHKYLNNVISDIINNKLLLTTLFEFDSKFEYAKSISIVKKIDFLFWEAGKLLVNSKK